MKIKIEDLTGEGLTFDAVIEGASLAALGKDTEFEFQKPIKGTITVKKHGALIDIEGSVRAEVGAKCSRCLKDYFFGVDSAISNRIVLGSSHDTEKELSRDEIEITYFTGEELDTSDILSEQVMLELPHKTLCSPDCKGLCPECGADLNSGPCGCAKHERVDPRFKKLKEFKTKK